MSASMLVMSYAFSAICSFVLSWSLNKPSPFPSWDDVSPFVLVGSTHKPVAGSLPPVQTILSLKQTQHSCASQTTLHPASVNILIEINDVCAIPGTMCACLASLGSLGTLISHVCIDFNWLPCGRLIVRVFFMIFMLDTFVPGSMKCPVVPESATAISTAILMFDALALYPHSVLSGHDALSGGVGRYFWWACHFYFCPVRSCF